MSERTFRILLGSFLVIGLYFDLDRLLWGLVIVLVFQGVTNWRVAFLVSRLRYGAAYELPYCCSHVPDLPPSRINFEAERALCLIVASLLAASVNTTLFWFVPWLVGFGLLGAGLSGICPMLVGLRWLGFR